MNLEVSKTNVKNSEFVTFPITLNAAHFTARKRAAQVKH